MGGLAGHPPDRAGPLATRALPGEGAWVGISDDGQRTAVQLEDGWVMTGAGLLLGTAIPPPGRQPGVVALSPDGRTLAQASDEGMRLHDLGAGAALP